MVEAALGAGGLACRGRRRLAVAVRGVARPARRRPPRRFSFSQRAASIGVSEKLMIMLTRIVADMVTPNDFRNRPTIPPMNAIGRKTAISESVIESTARPISLVAAKAASHGRAVLLLDVAVDVLQHDDRVVDHDAHRKGQRQERDAVEREAHVVDDGERGDDRRGDRQRRDHRGAEVGQEEEDHHGGQHAAQHQVLLDRVDRRLDEDRLVADHA